MIYQNVEFSNCAEIINVDGGVALQRVPESVRLKLNPSAQQQMLRPASGEIRFHTEPGETVKVTLSSAATTGVVVFFGDHRHTGVIVVGSEPQEIEIAWSERLRVGLDALRQRPHTFDPCVVRLLMFGGQIRFHGVQGVGVRPPEPQELPQIRLMTYGTSITHGASALAAHLSYAAQTARRIGADLLNFGSSGSCHCEPELADYMAGRADWNIASLALSVNMMGFEAEEFKKRVRYTVHTVAGANPKRPVACITLFSYVGDLDVDDQNHNLGKVKLFRQILRDAVRDCPTPNAHIIEGTNILRNFGGLTTDLVHPADDGMIEMGENLAAALRPLLPNAAAK